MKQKTRKFKLLLLSIFLGIVSCQSEEEIIEQGNYQNSFSVERISESQFRQKAPKAFGKMELLKKNSLNNTHQRNISINNEFNVDTDEILQITKGNQVSYTLPIHRTIDNGLVENLVITLRDDFYKAKIVTYNITDAEKEAIKNGTLIDVSDKISVDNLENGNLIATSVMNRDVKNCIDTKIEYERCCSGEHTSKDVAQGMVCRCPNPPTGYTYTIVSVPCEEQHYGGGTNPQNPNPTNPTNPNEPIDDFEDTTLPSLPKTNKSCEDLKTKSNDSDFKANMTTLKNDADNPVESGYVMYKDSPKYSNKQTGGIDDSGSYLDLEYDTSRAATITGFTHCHLNNATIKNFAVFSLDDLIMFGKLIENSTVPLEELTMFVTSNKGTFALKIKDKTNFVNAINSITPALYDMYDNIFKNKIN